MGVAVAVFKAAEGEASSNGVVTRARRPPAAAPAAAPMGPPTAAPTARPAETLAMRRGGAAALRARHLKLQKTTNQPV